MSSNPGSDSDSAPDSGESNASSADSGSARSDPGSSDSGERQSESGRSASDRGRKGWLVLTGDRLAVAGLLVGCVLLALLAVLWALGFPSVRPASAIYFLFSSLLTGDLTLITVVLSINQLVLSRELGAPGTLNERVRGALDYRDEVEETTGTTPTPETPGRFLQFLHESLASQTRRLDDATSAVSDPQVRGRLRDLVSSLDDDVRLVGESLDREGDGAFAVVSATVATNHADQLHRIAQLRDADRDALTDDAAGALDAIRSHLLQIDVARNYFETVYVQKELAYLSRVLLYVGVPAVVLDGLALVVYNAVGPLALPSLAVYAVVVVGFTAGFAPLAVLFAFVLRLAWVAQRTATVVPFTSSGDYRP